MKPTAIIIHCSATKENVDFTVEQIDASHRARGFKRPVQADRLKHIGYHYYIRKDGTICEGRREDEVGAHCPGWNDRSIGICYEGGLDVKGNQKDTRTKQQKEQMGLLVSDICNRHRIFTIKGHRDTSPDLNGNGVIEPFEWLKACPCFEVGKEYTSFMKPVKVKK